MGEKEKVKKKRKKGRKRREKKRGPIRVKKKEDILILFAV